MFGSFSWSALYCECLSQKDSEVSISLLSWSSLLICSLGALSYLLNVLASSWSPQYYMMLSALRQDEASSLEGSVDGVAF